GDAEVDLQAVPVDAHDVGQVPGLAAPGGLHQRLYRDRVERSAPGVVDLERALGRHVRDALGVGDGVARTIALAPGDQPRLLGADLAGLPAVVLGDGGAEGGLGDQDRVSARRTAVRVLGDDRARRVVERLLSHGGCSCGGCWWEVPWSGRDSGAAYAGQ